ncbi:MAG: HEAT repeat domain-containing protein [Pirellulaceae bacterium]|nr:HEAT repeat domain-containing protein [Pirellulaceae bacterium]
MQLTRFDATTMQSEVVCQLPEFVGKMHEPRLSRRGDASIFVQVGRQGQYRVDLAGKRLVKDNRVGAGYELRSSAKSTSLWRGDQELSPRTAVDRVFAAPDGKQVAWLPHDVGASNIIRRGPVDLRMHDSVRGVRTVMREWFARRGQTARDGSINLCLWLSDRDLKRKGAFDRFPVTEKRGPPAPLENEGGKDQAAEVEELKVEELIEQLSSSDGGVRGRAAYQLGELGAEAAPAIPHLINQFGDLLAPVVDPEHDHGTQISVVAMNSLASIGEPAVQPLIDAMLDKEVRQDRRACCAQTLGMLKDPRSYDALIQAVADEHQGLRLQAGMALRRIGDPVFDKLAAVIDDENPHVRLGATRGLQSIKSARATGLLIARLGDEDHQVRYAAAGALGSRNGEKAVVDALLLATNDSHKETRAEVYGALCYCRDPRLLKLLIAGLNDSNPVVQWRSAEGLGSLKSPTAVDPLLTALKSADESLRSNAARSLGAIGDKRALNALIEIARTDPEEDVRVTAGRAIGELEHPQASRGEVAWGKAVDGVQLGLSCETGLRPYRVGEVVRFERLIRNRSDRPWRFKVEIGPRINPHTAGGVTTLHSGESSDGPINVRSVTVDPGQDGWLDTVDFKIQSPGSSQRSQLSALQLPAGEHTITTRLDRTGFGPAQQPGVWMRALTAGQVEFVIRDGGAAGATKDAPRPESQSVLGRVKQLVESPNKTTAERLESTRAQLKMATAGLGEQQRQSIRNAFVMSAVGYLDSANRRARCDAGVVLVGLDDERGLASIIKELQDKKPRPTKMSRSDGRPHVDGQIASDRYYAALLLGQLGDNRAVPALIEATKDETINYRAAISLGEIGDKRAIPALRAMATAVPDQQLWAGYGLAALGEQQGFDLLSTAALTDPKWTDRRHAVEALGGVGDRRAVPTVVKVLQTDKHENVRVSAARALGEIGDPAALPALRAALNDKVVTKVNAPTTVAKEARSAIAAIEAGDDNAASRAGEDDVRVVVDRFIRAVSNQDTDAIARDAVSPWIDREEIRDDPIADIFSGIQLSASFRTSPKRIAVVESLKEVERIRGEAFPADVRQRWFEVVTDDHRIALIGGGKLVTAWAVRRNSGRAKVCGLLFAYYPSDEDALAKVLPPRASAAGQDGDEPKPRDRRQSTNRVVDAQGKPIVGATVEVLPYTVSEKPPLGSTKTDQQGRFEYPLETPEKKVFYIRISADGFVSERWIGNHRVHIRKNGQLEPDEFRLDRAATLRGRVIGADGEGLANIPLAFDYFNDRVASVNNRRFKSDTDGRFELTDLPAGELFVRYDPYKGQVKYRDAVFFVAHRTVRDGQTVENVVLDLSQCRCEIAGRVVDEQGKGRGNITVRAAFAFSARRLDHAVSAKTDDAGRFEFKNLPPHAFELSARTRGGGLGKRVIVQLRQGEQTKLTMHAYIPGHAPPADREVALNWGPERENLEAALFVEPSRPFERGDSMDVRIAVRNVGDAPRVFRDTLSFNRLHIFGPHGHETRDFRAFTGRPWSESYRLEPGHEVVLKGSFNLRWMGPDDTGPKNSMFRINHYAQKTYQLQVSFGDGFDSKRRPPAGNSRWMTDKLQIRTK